MISITQVLFHIIGIELHVDWLHPTLLSLNPHIGIGFYHCSKVAVKLFSLYR